MRTTSNADRRAVFSCFGGASVLASRLVRSLAPPKWTAGFSLLEVMVAILILGVALVGLTQGIATSLGSGKDSELLTTAAMFAAGRVEQLRVETGLKDEETQGDCGEGLPLYRWRQIVTPAGIDGLHDVEVVVENTSSGKTIYELRTLLFEAPADSNSKSSDRNSASQRSGGQR